MYNENLLDLSEGEKIEFYFWNSLLKFLYFLIKKN